MMAGWRHGAWGVLLLLVTLALMTCLAFAEESGESSSQPELGEVIVLPSTPPVFEDDPAFQDQQEFDVQEAPPAVLESHSETLPQADAGSFPRREGDFWSLDVDSVLLLGGAVWYLVALVGVLGGRGGRRGQQRL